MSDRPTVMDMDDYNRLGPASRQAITRWVNAHNLGSAFKIELTEYGGVLVDHYPRTHRDGYWSVAGAGNMHWMDCPARHDATSGIIWFKQRFVPCPPPPAWKPMSRRPDTR